MDLNSKLFDKFNILETPVIGFTKDQYNKDKRFITLKMPRMLGMQLRKYRLQHRVEYPELNVQSPSGTIIKFKNPVTTAEGIDYHTSKITLRLLDE